MKVVVLIHCAMVITLKYDESLKLQLWLVMTLKSSRASANLSVPEIAMEMVDLALI